jgi:hypothetical protein
MKVNLLNSFFLSYHLFFFWIRGNSTSRKAHFVGPGEWVKLRLSQALTRGARPDSNSRPAVQISSLLSSRYAPWEPYHLLLSVYTLWEISKEFEYGIYLIVRGISHFKGKLLVVARIMLIHIFYRRE